jgi:hypothetical protein
MLHLFLMDTKGEHQTHLIRGGSASWSPDGNNIAFHRSASGTGLPVTPTAGAATIDSDIFVLNVDDFLAGREGATNITNRVGTVDDDPDCSFSDKIVFTSHDDARVPAHAAEREPLAGHRLRLARRAALPGLEARALMAWAGRGVPRPPPRLHWSAPTS